MPYSDNMYSMDDDMDGEDHTDHLSPSDGQFPSSSTNVTPRIPNVFIPESRLPGEPEIKTSSTASRQITQSLSSATQSLSRMLPSRAQTPSVYSEAPPAYSPSANSDPGPYRSPPSQQDHTPRNYNTFGRNHTMGVPEAENDRLLGRHPESMGAPVDEERGAPNPAWARRAHRCLPQWMSWRYVLLTLVVVVGSLAILKMASPSSSHSRPGMPIDKPDAQVPGDDDSGRPEDPHDPVSPGSPFDSPYCQGEQHRYNDQVMSLDFGGSKNVYFREKGHKHPGSTTVRVGGQIDVRRLKEGDDDPRLVLQIATNDPSLRLYTTLTADMQEAQISIPETFESSVPGQRPCIEIRGTYWVPKDGKINVLSISTVHLGISLLDDLSLKVADYTDLISVAGSIKAAVPESVPSQKDLSISKSNKNFPFKPAPNTWAFDSRVVEVHTTAGRIEGNWPLYDKLGLHSTAGSQSVSITPHKELASDPKPAVLSISSVSGSISASEPIHELSRIPRRNYLVDVKTTAGSVHASLAFSDEMKIHTTAGSLELDFLPVLNVDATTPESPAQLETMTTSASMKIRVLEPVLFGKDGKTFATDGEGNDTLADMTTRAVLDCLDAKHHSMSGSVDLRYPQSWEGVLSAHSMSGHINAKGKDLQITYKGGWPGSKMEAHKGAEGKKSTIDVETLSGGMDAIIGDE
ncbi:hypothetical protein F4808DRAFT_244608 [Astrocystis sublimbata]|nr:hypothetical protein F4808DRAFT_244608 [Astrocystis sublimbata]